MVSIRKWVQVGVIGLGLTLTQGCASTFPNLPWNSKKPTDLEQVEAELQRRRDTCTKEGLWKIADPDTQKSSLGFNWMGAETTVTEDARRATCDMDGDGNVDIQRDMTESQVRKGSKGAYLKETHKLAEGETLELTYRTDGTATLEQSTGAKDPATKALRIFDKTGKEVYRGKIITEAHPEIEPESPQAKFYSLFGGITGRQTIEARRFNEEKDCWQYKRQQVDHLAKHDATSISEYSLKEGAYLATRLQFTNDNGDEITCLARATTPWVDKFSGVEKARTKTPKKLPKNCQYVKK